MCVRPCVRVYMLMPTCVYAGVRAYPPVCVCTFLGSARELTGAEKTATVTEETDIDAEEAVVQAPVAEELNNLNRGVTDLDATAKTPELNLNHAESKVNRHPAPVMTSEVVRSLAPGRFYSLGIGFKIGFGPFFAEIFKLKNSCH